MAGRVAARQFREPGLRSRREPGGPDRLRGRAPLPESGHAGRRRTVLADRARVRGGCRRRGGRAETRRDGRPGARGTGRFPSRRPAGRTRPRSSCAGSRLSDRTRASSCSSTTSGRTTRGAARARYADRDRGRAFPVEQAAAAALAVRSDVFARIGGFDERFVPAWHEDVDLCERLGREGTDPLPAGRAVPAPRRRLRLAARLRSLPADLLPQRDPLPRLALRRGRAPGLPACFSRKGWPSASWSFRSARPSRVPGPRPPGPTCAC